MRRVKGDMEKMWATIKQHAEELLSRRNVSMHGVCSYVKGG